MEYLAPTTSAVTWHLTSMFTAAFDTSQRRTYGSGGLMYPSASDTTSVARGREMSQTGAMITRRNLNVKPTVKVLVAYKLTVRVHRNIFFQGFWCNSNERGIWRFAVRLKEAQKFAALF